MDTKTKVLRRREAAAYLGIGLNTLDALISRRVHPLPHFRVGRCVLIPNGEPLDTWLAEEIARTCGSEGVRL